MLTLLTGLRQIKTNIQICLCLGVKSLLLSNFVDILLSICVDILLSNFVDILLRNFVDIFLNNFVDILLSQHICSRELNYSFLGSHQLKLQMNLATGENTFYCKVGLKG
jgi:hypothetical protein